MASRWVQKIWPFLDDSKLTVRSGGKLLYDWCGWCLAVTDACFGVSPFAASAQVAWNVNPDKRTNIWDLPIGIYVPLFWTGDKQGYGHVVVALRTADNYIKIWSSPYTHKPYFDYFEGALQETIDTITRKYGLTRCVGWSPVLGDKTIAALEYTVELEPVITPEPTPEPVVEEPVEPVEPIESEPVVENPPEIEQPAPAVITDDCEKITKEDFEKALERNITYMEKVNEIITEAGQGITFSAKTKKIVYIVCDLLLLAGAEVTPIMTMLNSANDPTTFGSALTQALFIAGFGGLMIFKLLKAKGDKKTETPTTPEA